MHHIGHRLLVIAAGLTLLAQTALAQQPDNAGPAGPPGPPAGDRQVFISAGPGPSPFLILLRAAKLTPAQQSEVRQIMAAETATTRPLMDQLRGIEDQISQKLLSPGAVTEVDLAPLEQQATRIREQMDQGSLDTSLKIRKLLTADQIGRLADVHEKLGKLRAEIENLVGPGPAGIGMLMAPGR
jgi:hypothetical protein